MNLSLEGSGFLPTAELTSYSWGTVTIDSAAMDFANLTTANAAQFLVSNGAHQSFPQLTSYDGLYPNANFVLEASGAGSVLDMSSVRTFAGQTNGSWQSLYVDALGGGLVKLGNVQSITQGRTNFIARGRTATAPPVRSIFRR